MVGNRRLLRVFVDSVFVDSLYHRIKTIPPSLESRLRIISSRWTRFIKWASPIGWIGGLGYFAFDSARDGRLDMLLAVIVSALALVGLALMKVFIWNLADEVYDCGDSLLVRRGGVEERVRFADIESVSLALYSRPPRITLRRANEKRPIVFTPPTAPGLELFGRNPIAEDLKARIQRAR